MEWLKSYDHNDAKQKETNMRVTGKEKNFLSKKLVDTLQSYREMFKKQHLNSTNNVKSITPSWKSS